MNETGTVLTHGTEMCYYRSNWIYADGRVYSLVCNICLQWLIKLTELKKNEI